MILDAGAAGIAVASSPRTRRPDLEIAIIDAAAGHYDQPGWTMAGAGIFEPEDTVRTMAPLVPDGVRWIKARVATFESDKKAIMLEDGPMIR